MSKQAPQLNPRHTADSNLEDLSGVMFFVPEMDPKRYAELVVQTANTVRGQMDKGYLPTIKRGKRRMINMAALTAENLNRK